MKKATKWAGLIIASAVCVTSVAMLAACNNDEPETKEYTVTYYDGTTVLDTQKVKEGEKATRWTPTKADYDFVDWYATPNFVHLFDFDAEITEDKSAFAQWVSSTQSVDTREYYIVGSGTSSILMQSNWGKVLNDDMKMTKTAGKNEYTYTIDLQVGDLFQFAINTDWHNQRGVGYLATKTLADGTEVFSGSSTIGDNADYRLNIKCEYAGNYTFTLTTHPDDDTYETTNQSYTEANKEAFNINPLDSITWVRNGDVAEVTDVVTNYFIKGSGITNWFDMYNAATKMTAVEGIHTLEVYLKADEEFLFSSQNTVGTEVSTGTEFLRATNLDEASKAFVDKKPSENMVAKASGTYTFTYNEKTKVLSVAFDAEKTPVATDYYIDGTFAEGVDDWSDYCFNDDFKLMETASGSGIYEIRNVTLKADSEIVIQAFKAGSTDRGEWGTPGYNGLGSYNYTYLYGGGEDFTLVGDGNNNIKVLTEGTYNITFDSYAKIITIKSAEITGFDVYIKGGMNSWNHNFDAQYKMTESDANIYEITLAFEADWEVGLAKYDEGATTGGGDWIGLANLGTSGDANEQFVQESGNLKCKTAGTYKVTYNLETGKIDFYAVANA